MAAWLIAAIERLRPRGRRVVVAAAALLLLAGAIASLSLQAGRGRRAGRSVVIVRAPARRPAAPPVPPRVRPPVSGSDLRLASRVAGQIVACYERSLGVPFVSGPFGFSLRQSVRLWLHRLGPRVLSVSS